MIPAVTGLRAFDEFQTMDFVVKVAERCNIACTYCYFFFRGDDGYKEHPPYITEEVTESFVAMLRRLAANDGLKRVRVGLHGGEPLMVPRKALANFCGRVRELKEDGTLEDVAITMQTNAMLVTQDWIDFLSEFEIGAGVSLDGGKAINDSARIDKRGRGTYDRAVAGYRALFGAARAGAIPGPGLLGVAHAEASGREAFSHYAEELKTRSMNFLLPDFTHEDEVAPAYVAELERFLIEVFRAWTAKGDAGIRVRFVDEILGPLVYDEVATAFQRGYGDQRHIWTISSNGDVSPVDTVRTLDARFRAFRHADAVHSIRDILGEAPMEELREARATPPTACSACEWWGICRGGSPVNRFSRERGFDNPSIYCEALKSIYLEVASWLVEQGVELEAIENRLAVARAEPALAA